MPHVLSLLAQDVDGERVLLPVVDGRSLVDLVAEYEAARGYEPAGAYGGLHLERFRFGDLADYFLSTGRGGWPRGEPLWLLGCDCGEVGCWPLEARATVAEDRVTWSHFAQPHRRGWSYAGFGPFVFDELPYRAAVARWSG